MRHSSGNQRALRVALLPTLLAGLLAACGGGGITGQELTGKVMDGYIKGAVVCLDVNANGVCNSDEPQAETTTGGVYSLDVPADAELGGTNLLVEVPVGAIDEDTPDTPIATAYKMRGVASAEAVVSPLTTVLAAHLDNGETEADALTAMGLTGVDLKADYVATGNTKVHNVAKLLARNFQAAGPQTAAQIRARVATIKASLQTAHATTTAMSEDSLLALVPASSGGSTSAGLTFDEDTQPTVEVFGGAEGTIAAGPEGGTGAALKVTRSGGEVWAGAWVPFTVPSTSSTLTISAHVYSPVAGVPIVTKAEWASEQGTGDTQANEQVVVGWQTLTWTYNNIDTSKTYNRFVVLPQLGTVGSGQVFYFDDLTATAGSSSGGSSGGSSGETAGSTLTLSTGFASAVATIEGGLVTTSGGSNFDNWGANCVDNEAVCGTFSGGAAADSYAGFYYQTTSPADGLYSQMEIFAPGVTTPFSQATGDLTGLTITDQTKVNFTFNQNPEWFNGSNNKFAVILTLGKRYAIDGGCYVQLHGVKAPTAVDATTYSMNLLTDFRVAANCGTDIQPDAVATALTNNPVSSVKFAGAAGGAAFEGRNGVKSGANLTTAKDGVYATTVVVKGGITFN